MTAPPSRTPAPSGSSLTSQKPGPRFLTVQEVADRLGMSPWFVYDHGDELGLVKFGGANRYREDRVDEYLAERLKAGERAPESTPASPLTSAPRRQASPRNRRRRVALLEPGTGSGPERRAG
jgi:hypothetical protein